MMRFLLIEQFNQRNTKDCSVFIRDGQMYDEMTTIAINALQSSNFCLLCDSLAVDYVTCVQFGVTISLKGENELSLFFCPLIEMIGMIFTFDAFRFPEG